jgi:hypothetical protein
MMREEWKCGDDFLSFALESHAHLRPLSFALARCPHLHTLEEYDYYFKTFPQKRFYILRHFPTIWRFLDESDHVLLLSSEIFKSLEPPPNRSIESHILITSIENNAIAFALYYICLKSIDVVDTFGSFPELMLGGDFEISLEDTRALSSFFAKSTDNIDARIA